MILLDTNVLSASMHRQIDPVVVAWLDVLRDDNRAIVRAASQTSTV